MKIRIILWIVIGFSSVVSPEDFVSKIGNDGLCCRIRLEASNETTDQPIKIDESFWFGTIRVHSKVNNDVLFEELCTLNLSDKDNKTNFCQCPYGWGGDSCNETLFCTIPNSHSIVSRSAENPKWSRGPDPSTTANEVGQGSQDFIKEEMRHNRIEMRQPNPGRSTTSSKTSDFPDPTLPIKNRTSYEKTSKAVIMYLQSQWEKLPKCKPKCFDEIGSADFNCTRIKDMIYYTIPIDSACNKEAAAFDSGVGLDFLKKYQFYLMGSAIGIILFAMVVCIVCVRRKKRKIQNTNENGMPMVPNRQNYMEENLIYNS